MNNSSERQVVLQIPAPEEVQQEPLPGPKPAFSWMSVFVLAIGLVVYFGTLLYSTSATGIAVAIGLIMLGAVIYIGSILKKMAPPIDAPAIVEPPEPVSPSVLTDMPTDTSKRIPA